MGTRDLTVADNPQDELHDALLAEASWVQGLAHSLIDDEHGAADLAQDVLTAAVERPPHLRRSRLRGWLRGAARHLASRRHRDRRAREKREAHAARPQVGNPEEHAVERLRLHRRLTDAVLSLPEPYRTAVIARYFDGNTPAEIARQRDLRPELVRQQIHRALTMLRARLDKDFGNRAAWGTALATILRDPSATVGTAVGLAAVKKLAFAIVPAAVLLAIAYRVWAAEEGREVPVPDAGALVAIDLPSISPDAGRETRTERSLLVSPDASRLIVEVVDPRGLPVTGATVWSWFQDQSVLERRTTDDSGRTVHTASPNPGGVLVLPEDAAPVSRNLEEHQGVHRFVLHPGEELHGWVRVDGNLPVEPVSLTVTSNAPPFPEDLPVELLAELGQQDARHTHELTTRPDGSFRLGGLPPNWSGRVTIPLPHLYWFRDWHRPPTSDAFSGQTSMLLDGPRTGLQLELTRLQIVQGRIIWSDTRRGIEGVRLTVYAEFADGDTSPLMGLSTDPSGAFRIGVWPGSSALRIRWTDPKNRVAFETITLSIRAEGAVSNSLVFDASQLESPGNLGTIAVDRAAFQHFVVRDQEGQPVQGAFVSAEHLSQPSDEDGRGTVQRSGETYWVGGRGYRIHRQKPVSGTGSEQDPLVFVLEQGSLLSLSVRDLEGRVPEDVETELSWTELLFADTATGLPNGVHRALSLESWTGHSGPKYREGVPVPGSEGSLRVSLDAEGRALFPGLSPNRRLTVRILGALRDVGLEQQIVTPGPTGQKEIDLVLSPKPFRVQGRVVNDLGRALPNARVVVSRQQGEVRRSIRAQLDREGAFAFDPVYVAATDYRIDASHPGYVTETLDDVALGPETAPLVFQLERGNTVGVTVVDPTGTIVPLMSLQVEGMPDVKIDRLEPGVFAARDLPARLVVFECGIAGRLYRLKGDPRHGEARLVVPEVGRLVVSAPADLAEREGTAIRVRIASLGSPEIDLVKSISPRTRRTTEVLLPPGKYRATLLENHRELGQEIVSRVLLGPVELTVRARELVQCRM